MHRKNISRQDDNLHMLFLQISSYLVFFKIFLVNQNESFETTLLVFR